MIIVHLRYAPAILIMNSKSLRRLDQNLFRTQDLEHIICSNLDKITTTLIQDTIIL
jgi:hypothetical protein